MVNRTGSVVLGLAVPASLLVGGASLLGQGGQLHVAGAGLVACATLACLNVRRILSEPVPDLSVPEEGRIPALVAVGITVCAFLANVACVVAGAADGDTLFATSAVATATTTDYVVRSAAGRTHGRERTG